MSNVVHFLLAFLILIAACAVIGVGGIWEFLLPTLGGIGFAELLRSN